MNDPRPVLVVTSLHDPTADVVIRELHDRDIPVVRLDSGDFPASLSVEAEITPHGIQGRLLTPSRTADLANIRALFYRRPTGFAFLHLDEQDARFAITQARYGLGGVLASLPGCLYVNHPHRIGDAEFKPSGLAAAVEAGFLVPPTLVTSSPEATRALHRAARLGHLQAAAQPCLPSRWRLERREGRRGVRSGRRRRCGGHGPPVPETYPQDRRRTGDRHR